MCRISDTLRQHIPDSLPPRHPALPALTLMGGDARQLAMAAYFSQAGYSVQIIGLGDTPPTGVRVCHDMTRALEECDLLILPLPVTRDGIHVFTALDSHTDISLEALSQSLSHRPHVRVFGGRIPSDWSSSLRAYGCSVTDFYEREDVQIKNAHITAEGAIMTAMELTDTTVLGSSVAVIGYGRIGQYLSRMLVALGASVTVYARRSAALAQAVSDGCSTRYTTQLSTLTGGYDVIFNTVPARLIGKDILSIMPCQTLLIDLASAPFGIDPEAAGEATARCGLGVIFSPSIPGRYAPKSAGKVIAEGILSALKESQEGGESP